MHTDRTGQKVTATTEELTVYNMMRLRNLVLEKEL
jgi:hypothetical protein